MRNYRRYSGFSYPLKPVKTNLARKAGNHKNALILKRTCGFPGSPLGGDF